MLPMNRRETSFSMPGMRPYFMLVLRPHPQRTARRRQRPVLRAVGRVAQADLCAPAVQRPHVAQRVRPGHGGGGRLAALDVGRHRVRFDAVEPLVGLDDDLLLLLALALQQDGAYAALAGRYPGPRQDDAALQAVDAGRVVLADTHAGGHLRDDAARELQHGRRPLVHVRLPDLAAALHFDGVQEVLPGRGARDQARERDGIAAHVQNATAAERVVHQAALGVRAGLEAEGRLDGADAPDRPLAHQLRHPPRGRMAAVHERLHQEHVVLARRVHDGHRLGVVDGQRLLAQDVLAGLGRLDGPLGVHRVGGGDVDGLHLRVRQQGLVSGVAAGDGELVGERVGRLLPAAAHGVQHAAFRVEHSLCEVVGDGARSDDAPAQTLGHGGSLSFP